MMTNIKNYLLGIKEIISIISIASKKLMLLLILNNLMRNALWPIRALAIKQIINIISSSIVNGFIDEYKTNMIFSLSVFFLTFWANRIWWPLNSYAQALMLAKVSNEVKIRIINVMQKVNLSFFDDPESYDLYTNAVSQADSRRPINIINSILNFISTIISFSIAFIVMLQLNTYLTILLLLSSIPAIFWENKFNSKKFAFEQETTRQRRMLDYIFGLYLNKTSAKELRQFNTFDHLNDKYSNELKTYNDKTVKLNKTKFIIDLPVWAIMQIAVLVSYYFIFTAVAKTQILLGELSFFITVAGEIQDAIKKIGDSVNGTIDSSRYALNLVKLRQTSYIVKDNNLNQPLNTNDQIEFQFRNVSFKYPNSRKYAVKNVSFIISAPQHIIIAGENGSGKTTLLKLLLRLYEPDEGEILLNKVNINQYEIHQYRRLFSACFQDYFKYGFTFKENICLANRELTQSQLDQIVKKTQLEECRERLLYGYNTYLSRDLDEKGVELSGGQYNRLAIARAFAKEASIVLLDEPTAALDAKAERNLFELYDSLSDNKLAVMVTHRLSTALSSNKILVMDNGVLVEQGSHYELINSKGIYYKLFMLQAARYMEEGVDYEAAKQCKRID